MGMKACEIFNDIDELFTNYETNKEQFNNEYGLYNEYCPVQNGLRKCETDYEKLTAMSGYAYKELMQNKKMDLENENDPSSDFLVMGLCDILYKLSNDPNLSLKDSFKKYLGKPIGSFNYWSILRNKKYFIGSNIGIMNGFYLLFKQICKTISAYNKSNIQPYEYISSIAQCHIMYTQLYNFVNQCDPYLRLLYHLKKMYDEFTKSVIHYYNHDESIRSQIMELPPIDKTTFESEFNTKGCKRLHKKLEQNMSRTVYKPQDEQEEQDELNTLINLLGFDDDNTVGDDSDDDEDGGDDTASTDGTGESDTQTDINNGIGNSQDKHDTQGNDQKSSDDGQVNQPPSSNDQIANPEGSGGGKDNLNSVPEGSNGGLGNSGTGQGDTNKEPENSKSQQNDQSVTQDDSLKKEEESGSIEKLQNIFNSVQNKLENYRSSFYEASTNIGKRLYENVSSTLENAYNGSITFGKTIITNLNEKIEKTINNLIPSNDKPELQDPKKEPPSKDNLHNSPTLNNNPSEPNPPPLPSKEPDPENNKVHNDQPQCKKNDEPTSQAINGGSQNSVDSMTSLVVKQEDTGTEVKGNKTTEIGDMHILKEYKQIGISIIILLIPIALAIMYKYLSSGWRKELKRKKTMKKVINSIGGKRSVQIIISSSSHKKQTKKSINSVHRKKPPLLNIYKLMQADPIPFINSFFLLIFFVYKRKYDFLEL
ncbi:PIR protein CIR protein [Plasmodium vinckei lentum]|uniref:PIR protein CIR protein n=1 Tax=Plasmodium vinckei lentum TaxID=138297 RepID=A0A6V7RT45_PLAVN|nr:PIR protein CIR protein [Plasmodium vinckei lentum]